MRAPLCVVVDTREKAPLQFSDRVVAVRDTLPTGDYSIRGAERELAVERKSLDDFVSSVLHERPRFKRELARLRAYRAACIVVEASLADILGHRYYSRAHPAAVAGAAIAILVDYGIPVVFCSDREGAARFTEGYLVRSYQKVRAECRSE